MNNGKITSSWVFRLIFINVVVYVLQKLTMGYLVNDPLLINANPMLREISIMTYFGSLRPILIVEKGYIWQLFSYTFLHDPVSMFHIFFNMYALLICGIPIEQLWGGKKFLFYYFFTGIGAGICIFVMTYFWGNPYIATLGASGAVFGILLAFGILFPDVEFLVFFIIPMKAKYFVIVYGLIELFFTVNPAGDNISHIGHLGGLVFGLIYFFIMRRRGITFKSKMLTAQFQKDHIDNAIDNKVEVDDNREFLRNFYAKVKQGGLTSVTDDEYQKYKYLEIMNEVTEGICVEEDFEIDDKHCEKCEHYEQCIIREIKKYF